MFDVLVDGEVCKGVEKGIECNKSAKEPQDKDYYECNTTHLG